MSSVLYAFGWSDKELNPGHPNDVLHADFLGSYRFQESTNSDVYIFDLAWKLIYTAHDNWPSLYTEGELYTIQGSSDGIPFAGGCDPNRCDSLSANIWGGAFRLGAQEESKQWSGYLELGFSTGDDKIFADPTLTERPNHPDYRVGLLTYQVAVYAASAQQGADLAGLWSYGGVYNSKYLYPQFRYELIDGVEAHIAWVFAWADTLSPAVYVNERPGGEASCGLVDGDCFIGWEVDGAIRVKWGKDDLLRWDTEFGLMRAGAALHQDGVDFGLGEPWLWTLQTRIAMVF